MASVVTVNDVLDGHVGLDLECLDRIYLNGYVSMLQVPGQVFTFLTRHLGKPIASPAVRYRHDPQPQQRHYRPPRPPRLLTRPAPSRPPQRHRPRLGGSQGVRGRSGFGRATSSGVTLCGAETRAPQTHKPFRPTG